MKIEITIYEGKMLFDFYRDGFQEYRKLQRKRNKGSLWPYEMKQIVKQLRQLQGLIRKFSMDTKFAKLDSNPQINKMYKEG